MSYAVVHMQKFKNCGVKGIQFHNQRERESKTNFDIDKSKSYLNYDLANDFNIDFNKKIQNIIKNNVQTTRAIRKDAVVMCNFIISSDKEFFDKMSVKEQNKFFKDSYEFFKDIYGENRIVASNVHLDEKTPHMHLSIVPVTKENKLSAKSLLDRNALRGLQDEFPKYMQSKGFDLKRGIDANGVNKHIDTEKLKKIEIEQRNISLLKEKEHLEREIKILEEKKIDVQQTIKNYEDIPEGKNILKKFVMLSKQEWKDMHNQCQSFYIESKQREKFENKCSDLNIKNNQLEQENKKLREENINLKQKNKLGINKNNLSVQFINDIPGEMKNKLPIAKLIRKYKSLEKPTNQDVIKQKEQEISKREDKKIKRNNTMEIDM